ncbi:MAG: 5,10-methylenetetrahydrofolate reductase [Planctomycetota bacterium]|jgi:methylenetetrahydrofolate reductase (NADPH)
MSLSQYFSGSKRGLSFELFPPKSDAGMASLLETVDELMAFEPDFFTCTYGAGGSTRDRTLQVVEAVAKKHNVPVASHLTCVGSTVDQLRDYLRAAKQAMVTHIVALRGDPPKGETEFRAVEGGLSYANELVALIRKEFPELGIAVAGYPEVHQEAVDAVTDLKNLKRKVDAGADIVVTQLFYDNSDFFRFEEDCRNNGIQVPIVPGILPVTNLAQIQRITSLCKAKLPQSFVDRLGERSDEQWQFEVGVEFAQQQVSELLDRGVPGIHFYVLNKSQATRRVLEAVRFCESRV